MTRRPLQATLQRIRAGVTGRFDQGSGTSIGVVSKASTTMLRRPVRDWASSSLAVAQELNRGHGRRRVVDIGAETARAKRIHVFVPAALCEMDVIGAAFVDDVAQELMETNHLMVPDGRLDVPVAECPLSLP